MNFIAVVFYNTSHARYQQSNSLLCAFTQGKPTWGKPLHKFGTRAKVKVENSNVDILKGVQIVQQYARWIILSWTLVFRMICPGLKEAYPDLMCLQNEGVFRVKTNEITREDLCFEFNAIHRFVAGT